MLRSLMLMATAIVALSGCAGTRIVDTKTIHNADASRIWIVQEAGGDQHVVMCDVTMFQTTRVLCTRWPAP